MTGLPTSGNLNSFITQNSLTYTVYHPLVVDVSCVLLLSQSVCMVHKQNTQNIYQKRMINGVYNVQNYVLGRTFS